jgi:D-alanyl-lipoteichoic acid acyltransferase DltB (MBOAT superfamily)
MAGGHPAHLLILLGSIVFNYTAADRVIAWRGTKRGKVVLVSALVANLSLLGWFKYAVFAAGMIEDLVGWRWTVHAVLLPLGISFFTFQKIAYLVDAWRGGFNEQRWSHYTLFVTFFPQLIAGPIVHHREFFPQLHGNEFGRWHTGRIVGGLAVFVLGVAKKVLLADTFGADADRIFGHFAAGHILGALDGWLGVLGYTFQIYFDFSGYSDMAIGLALLFGITLPENFVAPYRATSVIEFWRRWHVTLSRFLRDYVYIPLGGNRGGVGRQMRSLGITMVVGGLWHGAAWTFVVWGAIHGAALAVNHLWRRCALRMWSAVGWILTFGLVAVAWVFFRSPDFTSAGRALKAMSGGNGLWSPGTASLATWIKANRPLPEYRHLYELFSYLGWRSGPGWADLEWRDIVFSRGASQLLMLATGFGLVAFAPPALRWVWDLQRGQPRLSFGKAAVIGTLIVAVILHSTGRTPATFIYFRF